VRSTMCSQPQSGWCLCKKTTTPQACWVTFSSWRPIPCQSHLQEAFRRLQEHGLVVIKKKCEFGKTKLEYLSHTVDATGIRPSQAATEAITKFPTPKDKPGLQRFFGMLNFYHQFLLGLASTVAPLHTAFSGRGKEVTWSEQCEMAFKVSKTKLAKAATLHPLPFASLAVTVDASDIEIGAVLEQLHAGTWQPLAFFSW